MLLRLGLWWGLGGSMDWIDSLLPWIDNVLHEETDVDSIDPLPWRTRLLKQF